MKHDAFSVEKQKSVFAKEKERVEAIVKVIANRQENKIERSNFLINGIGNVIYTSILPKLRTLDQNFTVNEKCNHCNTCEKVCPVQNIEVINGRPNWQGNCEHCMACIQWCPAEAIQYGVQTIDRKRYHHPQILAKELYRED